MFKFHKKKHHNDKICLKCQYRDLYQEGKKIFTAWDKKGNPPKSLLNIQKQLMKIKAAIEKSKITNELQFCADHPEIYEYLPIEWT